jgi:hypothetical protein
VSGQAAIYNNLALAYRALGLYRRSNRMAHGPSRSGDACTISQRCELD